MAKTNNYKDKSVLVTGGTGTFGKAFVRYLLDNTEVSRVVIFSRDEQKQYDFEMSLSGEERSRVRFFIGDVRDHDRLSLAMRGISSVIHAAAMKIVMTAEYNPFECIQTNVHGAENVVRAAIEQNVERVVALSTDKACNPVNLYGASKLASDKIFVAANNLVGDGKTRFSVVRYGNVLGSRGSILPVFKRMLAGGAKYLPITDVRMTRFCITLQAGVEFVISSLSVMRGGEIFVPKLPSMRVTDLAEALAPHLPQKTIGIRPGEKLHEMMISRDDARTTLELEDRYIIEPANHFWDRSRLSHADAGAKQVNEGFEYASDTNSDWLDVSALKRLSE
ncbi:UDP-N-acetylglucosamine 4,6-dehydratase (inverting) [Thalassospira alkalitolerans]|uniref:UDP-N-acetylglucosamine 4,6-dehydratase (inverting) n=1 Tax=Thalassospira alkalitolerans TaxID=1293890 RepID=UPI0030EE56A2|tara:strand:- start:28587 stop:29591 length:1005 start_codon:yes stop_codon:yes gene_type:complete